MKPIQWLNHFNFDPKKYILKTQFTFFLHSKSQLNSEGLYMRSLFLRKCKPKITRISAQPNYQGS